MDFINAIVFMAIENKIKKIKKIGNTFVLVAG